MLKFKHRLRLAIASIVAALLVSGLSAPAFADDAPPSGYPSWQDVQNAKANEASKATEVQKIQTLLDGLNAKVGQLSDESVAANQKYATTKTLADQAHIRTQSLQEQFTLASGKADALKRQTAQLAVNLYKNGGTSLGVFSALSQFSSPNGLENTGMVSYVSDSMAQTAAKAKEAASTANALREQQAQAQEEQDRLTQQAKDQYGLALQAQSAAQQELGTQQHNQQTLKAQLSDLTGKTQNVENAYQQGVQAQKDYEEAQAAKAAAAEREREAQMQQQQAQLQQQQTAQAAVVAPQTGAGQASSGGSGSSLPPSTGALNDPGGAQAYASSMLGSFGWGQDQMSCLIRLWNQESSWQTTATNPSSLAYGIPQSLPANKMASAGPDWLTNYRTQINWGLNYILGRYGSPCGAWAHEVSIGWY